MAVYFALAVGFFGFVEMSAARIVLTLYALNLGAPGSAVGVVGGLFYVFPLLLSWPIGTLADRYSAVRLLLAGTACGAVALALPYFSHALTTFYTAAALCGLRSAFFHVTLQNLIGTLSKPEERARNFSNFSLMGATTNFAGPLYAGYCIDHMGHATACLFVAVLPVIAPRFCSPASG